MVDIQQAVDRGVTRPNPWAEQNSMVPTFATVIAADSSLSRSILPIDCSGLAFKGC